MIAHLRCPLCRGPAPDGSFHAYGLRQAPESAQLICVGCEARFGEVDGIPLILRDPERLETQPPRLRDIDAWCAALAESDPQSDAAREAWLVTLYALSHHPEACPSAFVREAMADQGRLSQHLTRWLEVHGGGIGEVLELGCGVGGHAAIWRQAASGSITLCDLRPSMLSTGRALHQGQPLALPWRTMGRHYVPMRLTPTPNALDDLHYVVGDALDPPFAAEHFDLVVALNLLDAIRDPWMLLGQLDALSAPGALLLLGQPFHYEAHAQHPEGWFTRPQALHDALGGGLTGLEHLDYEILESADGIPWSLPAHDRLVHRYGMHLVLARKRP